MQVEKNTRPFDFLSNSTNKNVMVKLKDGTIISGILKTFDVHLNIIVENAEEIVEGKTKAKHEKLLIRGDNILFISI